MAYTYVKHSLFLKAGRDFVLKKTDAVCTLRSAAGFS